MLLPATVTFSTNLARHFLTFALLVAFGTVLGCNPNADKGNAPAKVKMAGQNPAPPPDDSQTRTVPIQHPDPAAAEKARLAEEAKVERIMNAAKEGEAKGKTDCERAYHGLSSVATLLKAETPQAAVKPPDKSKFMPACKTMPAPAQRCLVVSHAFTNIQECRTVSANLTDEQKATIAAAAR